MLATLAVPVRPPALGSLAGERRPGLSYCTEPPGTLCVRPRRAGLCCAAPLARPAAPAERTPPAPEPPGIRPLLFLLSLLCFVCNVLCFVCNGADVEYLNSRDATIMGSRNGHAPIYMWYTFTRKVGAPAGMPRRAGSMRLALLGCRIWATAYRNTRCFCLLCACSSLLLPFPCLGAPPFAQRCGQSIR